jgi:hypothetical protein
VGGGCRGSVAFEARFPDQTSEYAETGTRLHALAGSVLRGETQLASCDAEDSRVVGPYVRDVASVLDGPHRQIEVEVSKVWNRAPVLQGTPDAVVYDYTQKRITIWDLKTGWGIVEVEKNWQLICYALMVAVRDWTIELRIAQPLPSHRDGPIRSWTISWDELQAFAPQVLTALAEIASPQPPLRPGRHCLYCAALAACPAAREVTLAAVDYASIEPAELPVEYVGRELAVLRETVKILELRTAALEESIAAKLRAGAKIPGVAMHEARGGRVKWAASEATVRETLQILTGKDYAVPKLPTPKQLKDAGLPECLLQPFTKYQPGKMVVTTDTEGAARKAFGAEPNMEHVPT